MVHRGEHLVDADEAASLLRRTRRTVTRMIACGRLKKVRVPKSKKAWLRLKDVELASGFGTSLERDGEPPHYRFLRRWHPEIFKEPSSRTPSDSM